MSKKNNIQKDIDEKTKSYQQKMKKLQDNMVAIDEEIENLKNAKDNSEKEKKYIEAIKKKEELKNTIDREKEEYKKELESLKVQEEETESKIRENANNYIETKENLTNDLIETNTAKEQNQKKYDMLLDKEENISDIKTFKSDAEKEKERRKKERQLKRYGIEKKRTIENISEDEQKEIAEGGIFNLSELFDVIEERYKILDKFANDYIVKAKYLKKIKKEISSENIRIKIKGNHEVISLFNYSDDKILTNDVIQVTFKGKHFYHRVDKQYLPYKECYETEDYCLTDLEIISFNDINELRESSYKLISKLKFDYDMRNIELEKKKKSNNLLKIREKEIKTFVEKFQDSGGKVKEELGENIHKYNIPYELLPLSDIDIVYRVVDENPKKTEDLVKLIKKKAIPGYIQYAENDTHDIPDDIPDDIKNGIDLFRSMINEAINKIETDIKEKINIAQKKNDLNEAKKNQSGENKNNERIQNLQIGGDPIGNKNREEDTEEEFMNQLLGQDEKKYVAVRDSFIGEGINPLFLRMLKNGIERSDSNEGINTNNEKKSIAIQFNDTHKNKKNQSNFEKYFGMTGGSIMTVNGEEIKSVNTIYHQMEKSMTQKKPLSITLKKKYS